LAVRKGISSVVRSVLVESRIDSGHSTPFQLSVTIENQVRDEKSIRQEESFYLTSEIQNLHLGIMLLGLNIVIFVMCKIQQQRKHNALISLLFQPLPS
jgi:hypothetical protein